MASKYRKKPIEVEAMLWDGLNMTAIQAWIGEHRPDTFREDIDGRARLWIEKGQTIAHLHTGDWIIKEPDGVGFYPCVASQFHETYESAEPAPTCSECGGTGWVVMPTGKKSYAGFIETAEEPCPRACAVPESSGEPQ